MCVCVCASENSRFLRKVILLERNRLLLSLDMKSPHRLRSDTIKTDSGAAGSDAADR